MNNVLEQYKQLKQALLEKRQEFSKVAKEALTEGAKTVFDSHPVLEKFGWNQYTPYFNDGDACTFSVYSDCPDLNGENYDDLHYQTKEWCSESRKYVDKRENTFKGTPEEFEAVKNLMAAGDSVKAFLTQFDDDLLKDIFGDHVTVTINRDGTVETDHYEHD